MAYRTQGVPPKPASKRRRRNVPASYGAAEPVTAPAASPGPRTLGIADAHPLIVDMARGAGIGREQILLCG